MIHRFCIVNILIFDRSIFGYCLVHLRGLIILGTVSSELCGVRAFRLISVDWFSLMINIYAMLSTFYNVNRIILYCSYYIVYFHIFRWTY